MPQAIATQPSMPLWVSQAWTKSATGVASEATRRTTMLTGGVAAFSSRCEAGLVSSVMDGCSAATPKAR
jgi:hypothetical protein